MCSATSSSAFWVRKGLRALKILSAISALYNQKYCYAISGIYDNVIYPPSHAGVLFRGRWAQGCHNVWYTLQNHQTVIEEGREENTLTPSDLCWWGGPLPQSDLRKYKRNVTLLSVSLAIFNCWWDATLGPTMGRTNHRFTTICCTDEHRSMQLQSSCSWLQTSSHRNTSGWHSQTNSSTTVSTF